MWCFNARSLVAIEAQYGRLNTGTYVFADILQSLSREAHSSEDDEIKCILRDLEKEIEHPGYRVMH